MTNFKRNVREVFMVRKDGLTDQVRQAAVRVREIAARTAQREAARRRRRRLLGTVAGVGGIGVAAGAVALRSSGAIEESVEVEVPISTAYNQWTQFEEFPQFMGGVDSVRQIDETHLHWAASIGGKTREWDAEITEQRPDERVAWTATSGKRNGGVVTFHHLSDSRSKVMVQLDYKPEGLVERVGSVTGADRRRVRADLKRFKGLIEARGTASGGWRGEVEHGEAVEQ